MMLTLANDLALLLCINQILSNIPALADDSVRKFDYHCIPLSLSSKYSFSSSLLKLSLIGTTLIPQSSIPVITNTKIDTIPKVKNQALSCWNSSWLLLSFIEFRECVYFFQATIN